MCKIIEHYKIPDKEVLKKLYDLCNEIFNDEKYFYTSDQVQKLKKEKRNIFLS